MSVSAAGVVSKPISLKEVADLIEEKTYDVATVCRSDKVNMWSPYRPIFYDSFEPIGDSERQSEKWGYVFSTQQNRQLLTPQAWRNSKPTSWCRLTDFEGYNHNAQKFIPTLQEQTVVLSNASVVPFKISLSDAIVSAGGLNKANISLGTLGGNIIYLKDCYLGIRMRLKGSNIYYYSTDYYGTKGLFTDLNIIRSMIPVKAGETWLALLFASAEPITAQSAGSGLFAVLDQSSEVEIHFREKNFMDSYYISLQLAQSTNRLTYSGDIVFTLYGNGPYQFGNIMVALYNKESYGYNPIKGWTYDRNITLNQSNKTVRIPISLTTDYVLSDPYFRLTATSYNENNKLINSGYQQALTFWEGGI